MVVEVSAFYYAGKDGEIIINGFIGYIVWKDLI
jgi:hypothetical protein